MKGVVPIMATNDLPPAQCTFVLNKQSVGALACEGRNYAAFSGNGKGIDNPAMTNVLMTGPIPKGRYYIVDRPHGGRLGWLHDFVHNALNSSVNTYWFALWADDGSIDDWTFVQGVKRGNFRLHPIGSLGISDGCITISDPARFGELRTRLLRSRASVIPGKGIRYYGTVDVK
jgi:hypothetical protein